MTHWLAAAVGLLAAPVASGLTLVRAPGSPVAMPTGAADVIARDFDGDGQVDLAVATRAGLVVMRGDGTGRFAPAPGSPLPVTAPPHLLAAGDLDRDGRTDIVATSHDTHAVVAWRSLGGGRFEPMPWSPVAALPDGRAHNHGLALGDLDRDGWLDVTTADDVAHILAVLRGGPAGPRPPARRSFAVGNSPYPHALGDLDGDGDLDAVVPNTGGASVTVLLGDGQGAFVPAAGSPVSVAPRPFYVALGDLDRSGGPDAVVTHDDLSSVTVLLGDGRGGLGRASTVHVGHRAWKAAVADMDADGRADVALAGQGRVTVMTGDGRGGLRHASGSRYDVGGGAWSLAVADFNGDGRPDVAVADVERNAVTVLVSSARARVD